MAITMDLTGRTAVVTGGSRGLGRAIALGLVEAGASVAVASRKLESCEALVVEIEAMGGSASAHAFDAASWEDCDRLFAEVTERWGGADSWSITRESPRLSLPPSKPAKPHSTT